MLIEAEALEVLAKLARTRCRVAQEAHAKRTAERQAAEKMHKQAGEQLECAYLREGQAAHEVEDAKRLLSDIETLLQEQTNGQSD